MDVRGWATKMVEAMSDREIAEVAAEGAGTWLTDRRQLPPGLDADDVRALAEEVEILVEARSSSLEAIQ